MALSIAPSLTPSSSSSSPSSLSSSTLLRVTTSEEFAAAVKDRQPFFVVPSLKELYLSNSSLEDEGLDFLLNTLHKTNNRSITLLSLRYNKLTCNGMRPLSTFLSYHPLQELSLQGNKITDQGASFLGESLRSNETLKILCLSNNQIGDQGIAQLAEALRHNKTLQQLDLEMNRIGDEGVIHLAEALRSNRTLKQLDLKRNRISAVGGEELFNAIDQSSNSSLEKLYIYSVMLKETNTVSSDLQERFWQILTQDARDSRRAGRPASCILTPQARERALEHREMVFIQKVTQAESQARERELEFQKRKEELDRREKELTAQQLAFEEKKRALEEQETKLRELERNLNGRESQMQEQQQTIQQLERQVQLLYNGLKLRAPSQGSGLTSGTLPS